MFTPEQLAGALGAPLENVRATWPATVAALQWQGIYRRSVAIAMAATIAVETAVTEDGRDMTFLPVRELGGPQAWYAPWYGRGTIQCTLRENYASYGSRMRPPRDLLANPDLLLAQEASAQFAALYFVDRGIPGMADGGNWYAVRVAVNGGTNGLDRFLAYVAALEQLEWLPEPPPPPLPLPAWWMVTQTGALKQQPNHTSHPALGPQRAPVTHLPLGTKLLPNHEHGPVRQVVDGETWICVFVPSLGAAWGYYLELNLKGMFQ